MQILTFLLPFPHTELGAPVMKMKGNVLSVLDRLKTFFQ